ncbi:cellulose synthase/poly-beta-1,6-N-acetylglucosamine synthase-like glycosyltransferase [Saccharothrix ecbatanensis]|uniref:Cellulose synthase/poly-beta-1,6-N-acetylglucosamine synthase-like glycosyltransferase n=1 Tax=Saccharothrix ecbatanensis TaxID=1105145 RepID=A0A7W9HK88_9PSEU|nr:glycosyltransferase family 2 protein [Saccharothrix ecbatanensis]MBB5803839.1 cellulose synthase/poly-beta-1,6-N-acetylglucosamine synthase-like glycosyltransferase [Saccharothrix ecbatanensis]
MGTAGALRTAPPAGRHALPQQSRVVALVPAHNEEAQIGATLAALERQSRRPDLVVVVCDNCTDHTASIARAAGATVLTTEGNKDKKAGALNQALSRVLPLLDDDDVVLVQDADSQLDTAFLDHALRYLRHGYGGVGGVFRGGPGGGFVGHLQRNEYARYARDVNRMGGRCLVITGTAAMFRVDVLREITAGRLTGLLPPGDRAGGVYDTTVLTEDNELTFALLHLGYRVISPPECGLETEVMLDWGSLWRQRLRWKRGAVENCVQYGLTKVTWRYWGRQLFTVLGVLISAVYLITLVVMAVAGELSVQPLWLTITLIFVVERVVTVRYRGWAQMVLAATMYELVLDYFLQACHAKAYFDALRRTTRTW